MKYTYIPTGIMGELMRFWYGFQPQGIHFQDCWRRNGGHSFSGQIIFSFTHIEGIMLGASEEVDEDCFRSKWHDVDRISDGERIDEGHAAGGVWDKFYTGVFEKGRSQ
jgi:hypothetical protein